ncbi:hypothetical protein AURDEDRAFT_170023 [Auricularia subglabra TFB-10046 SS5]|uniref:DUF6533 domain-containing protein n=1 Tax=Auricularia subglabra (strain TFB-10046 / SS5) TaxID=717982 RepID=J0DCT2_AURST|nr:hypothetical protein AURDEDRAFT_170023 [Auricularia subglabra TFB-10046 SS5]
MSSATVPTATGYLAWASITWLSYDYMITLNDEIELIWKRDWAFTKGLYLMMRWSTFGLLWTEIIFYVFLHNVRHSKCDAYSWAMATATFIVVLEVEVVLQLRIYAMFERSRRILWVNATLCALQVLCAAVIVAKNYSQAHWVAVPNWIIGSCYSLRPKVVATVWIAPLTYELYLASLAVYKVVRDRKTFGTWENDIQTVLVRDSVSYFFLIVIVAAVNIVMWTETVVTPGDSAVK